MASRNTLLPGLAAAGLGALFQPGQADFTGMVQQGGLAVDELQQSVFLALDEAGTEAAAATTASLVGALPPPALAFDLRVDRPFTFALRDERDGMPLFMGIVRDPSER
jgi:serpin B